MILHLLNLIHFRIKPTAQALKAVYCISLTLLLCPHVMVLLQMELSHTLLILFQLLTEHKLHSVLIIVCISIVIQLSQVHVSTITKFHKSFLGASGTPQLEATTQF
jgi:hypothetical protein